jgi:gas vesicle protein
MKKRQKAILKPMPEMRMHNIEIDPMIGGVVGAAVGAILGAAIATALKDKDVRQKISEFIGNATDTAMDRLKDVNKKADGIQTVVKDTLEENIDKIGNRYLH